MKVVDVKPSNFAHEWHATMARTQPGTPLFVVKDGQPVGFAVSVSGEAIRDATKLKEETHAAARQHGINPKTAAAISDTAAVFGELVKVEDPERSRTCWVRIIPSVPS